MREGFGKVLAGDAASASDAGRSDPAGDTNGCAGEFN